jgi:endothelin-converting enzyme
VFRPHVGYSVDGGWLNSHPLPADKGKFGSFDALSQQNQQLLQKILESNHSLSSNTPASYDDELLRKLRGLYSSCLDEKTLDGIGEEPLSRFVQILRKLYRGENTDTSGFSKDDRDKPEKKHGLTAAVAFLHSRGLLILLASCFFTEPSPRHRRIVQI